MKFSLFFIKLLISPIGQRILNLHTLEHPFPSAGRNIIMKGRLIVFFFNNVCVILISQE